MTDKESQELLFIANDAVENIARIKAASWGVLAAAGAVFGYIISSTKMPDHWLVPASFIVSNIFFLVVVCFVYPNKLNKYRSRLKRVLENFSITAQTAHGSVNTLDKEDGGDLIYKIISLLYFLVHNSDLLNIQM